MIKKTKKIFGLILIFQLIIGSIINAQNLNAKKVGLKPIPDVFNTYSKSAFISEINNGTKLVSNYMQSNSDLAWAVYSDREDNETFYDPNVSDVKKKIPFMNRYFVDKVDGNWIHLVSVKTKGWSTGHEIDEDIGWIEAKNLLLSKYAILSAKGAPKKKMILMSASDIDAEKLKDNRIFKDMNYFSSPKVKDGNLMKIYETSKLADKLKILFVLKETSSAVLLASSDKISNSPEVYGWIHQVKTTGWDTRVCLEPVSGPKTEKIFKNSDGSYQSAFVFLNSYDLDAFEDMGQIRPRVTFLKEFKLKKQRMSGMQMRYPVMPWEKNSSEKKKIAVIAQLGDLNEGPENTGGGDGCDRECQLANLKSQLDSVNRLANNVNALIVIDGTSSMTNYGPVVAKSIEKIINERQIDGKQKMKWGLAIYRDYLDDKRVFEIVPINDDHRGTVAKLKSIDYSSKNPVDAEAHYYGMTEAIKQAGFVKGQSNIIVLVGDAGNHLKDKNNLTAESVINLLVQKQINLISFQVNFKTGKAAPAYSKFSGDSRNYILNSAKKYINNLHKSKGLDVKLDRGKENSYSLGFTGFDKETTRPLFGVFNHAIPGQSMEVNTFRNNLVNSFLNYMNLLDEKRKEIDCLITGDCEKRPVELTEPIEIFDGGPPSDICRLLNISDEQCQLLVDQGQISIRGYTHMKLGDREVFNSVVFMEANYKKKLDERFNDLASIKGSKQKARDEFYYTLVSVIQGLVGEDTPESVIKTWTFDQTWDILLNMPFSTKSSLNTKQIQDLQTNNISDDEFEFFLENFKAQTDVFISFPREEDVKYSRYISGSQTFFWIPFSKIPRGE